MARIDEARAAGVAFDVLAARFGLSRQTLQRHWTNHVGPDRKLSFLVGKTAIEDLREKAAQENLSVLDYLSMLRSGLFRVFRTHVEMDDAFGSAAVAGRILDLLREAGRITGEIDKAIAPTVNVNVGISAAPGFSDLMTGMLAIARKHPEARADIIALVDRMSGAPLPQAMPLLECEPVDA